MDASELIPRLEAAAPKSILEVGPFGRSQELALWIEMKALSAVGRAIATDTDLPMDWLENITAMEIEGAIVLSYFLRSSRTGAHLVLRGSLVPAGFEDAVEVASVSQHWPPAVRLEAELSELFGIRFSGATPSARLLPEGWEGFPLRKAYVFPAEFLGIPHLRAVGKTAPDEHGALT